MSPITVSCLDRIVPSGKNRADTPYLMAFGAWPLLKMPVFLQVCISDFIDGFRKSQEDDIALKTVSGFEIRYPEACWWLLYMCRSLFGPSVNRVIEDVAKYPQAVLVFFKN